MDASTSTSCAPVCLGCGFGLFLAVYLGSAFSPALQDDVDSSHAEAAREMITRGDYVTLHINGVRYLEKAPLMYWLVAGCYRVLRRQRICRPPANRYRHVSARSARHGWGQPRLRHPRPDSTPDSSLPPALDISSLLACSFRRPFSACSSRLHSIAWFPRLSRPRRALEWYAVYALMALAVLTKGLLALVVIGITLVAYLAITGEWRRWREFHLFSGLLLFFAIAAPWHILAGLRNPGTPEPSRLLLVLLRQRTLPALPRQTHPKGLQQAPRLSLLEPAPGLALSLEPLLAGWRSDA